MKWMINITLSPKKAGFFVLILLISCEERIWDNIYDPNGKNVELDYNEFGSIVDIEGNIYKTIQIGTQIWMAENLKTTKYIDGTNIPKITDNSKWANLTTGAYCWYNNEIHNKDKYGSLYNGFALMSSKLCPEGWHIPCNQEWITLVNFLGGESYAGGKLKSKSGWIFPNSGATNNSGFSALPGGGRYSSVGLFHDSGKYSYFWSEDNGYMKLSYNFENIYHDYSRNRTNGFSVRCIKDN
jgi:uncharacterized protein (TIGR02145 family)